MKVVSILGCGWLGQVLGQNLLSKGYVVSGSVRSNGKATALTELGIKPHVLTVENEGIVGDFNAFIKNTEILVIAFPPGIRHNQNADYATRIQHVLTSIPSNCAVLHLSSIGVFGKSQGEVKESTTPKPNSFVGAQLLAAEKNSLSSKNPTSIVRLGGLVGNGRHPAKQLSGKHHLPAPNAPTNLVHQLDVVTFLTNVMEIDAWGHIFHCVSPIHYQRKAFYTRECREFNLPEPHFKDEVSTQNKKVVDTKSNALFEFEYAFSSCRLRDC